MKLIAPTSMVHGLPSRSGDTYSTVTTGPRYETRFTAPTPSMNIAPMSSALSTSASNVQIAIPAVASTRTTLWHVAWIELEPLEDDLRHFFIYAITAEPSNGDEMKPAL